MKKLKDYVINWKEDTEEEINAKFKGREEVFKLFCNEFDLGYGGLIVEDNLINFYTGGWSENEELISQLKKTSWWVGKNVIEISGGGFYIDLEPINTDKKHWKIIKE